LAFALARLALVRPIFGFVQASLARNLWVELIDLFWWLGGVLIELLMARQIASCRLIVELVRVGWRVGEVCPTNNEWVGSLRGLLELLKGMLVYCM
jgi:hypothetical protein